MDLKQLEYFVRVAEMGSFTRASISLDIAQPTLSRQIRLLESELQQHLLIRDGRGVAANEAGKLLLEHARGILHQVSRTREELDRARGLTSGVVAVGLPPSPARIITVPLTHEFVRRYPCATLTIRENLSVNLSEALLNGQLDLALLYNTPPIRDITLCPVRQDPLYLILHNAESYDGKPIRLEKLSEIPLLMPNKPHSLRMLLEREMAAIGAHPKIRMEIDSVPAILDLVLDGSGAAVLPLHAVQTSGKRESFVVREIVGPAVQSRIAVATSSTRPLTAIQRATAEMLAEIAIEHLAPQ